MKLVKRIGLTMLAFLPTIVLAQRPGSVIPDRPSGLPDAAGGGDLGDWILSIIEDYLLPFAGLLAVVFIIIGGYQYIFSGANEELAEKGKNTLRNAVIGLVIVILSYVIVRVVARTLGAR